MLTDPLKAAEVDLLMKEYLALRTEIVEFVRLYRAHIRNVTAVLTITVGLLTFAGKADVSNVVVHSRLFWFFVGITIATVVSYYAFDALDAHYAMFATASRAALIENMINERAGKILMTWETRLSDRFWWDSKSLNRPWWSDKGPLKEVNYPSKYLIGYLGIIVVLALFSEPVYSTYAFWHNPAYINLQQGRCLILLNWAYSAISCIFVFRVAPTVFWRTKGPARELARQVFKEAQLEFEIRRKVEDPEGEYREFRGQL
jgi:hypothetical protein